MATLSSIRLIDEALADLPDLKVAAARARGAAAMAEVVGANLWPTRGGRCRA